MSFIGKRDEIVPDIYTWRRWLLANKAQEFSQHFKLRLLTFLTVTKGFNLYEFRYRIGAGEGAWADIVREKFGDEGVALIELLVGHPQKIAPDGATIVKAAPKTKTERPETLGTMPFAVLLDEKRGPSTQQPPEVLGIPLTSLGNMFTSAPTQVEEAPDEEAPPTSGIASLFS